MLTSYLVSCPYFDCKWSGCLLPHEHLEAWRGATVRLTETVFECPQCRRHWQARIVGDDVEVFPLSAEHIGENGVLLGQ